MSLKCRKLKKEKSKVKSKTLQEVPVHLEFQKEFEEEEENNPPDDEDDDNNSDLLCEEDDEEDYDLCSGCDEKPIAHLVQPCGHMLCVNCVKKKKCQLCGSQIFNNVTIDFEDLS